MTTSQQNNKRIAKNTLFLYIRMFIMLAVGLFTSRVILDALGERDYGIYNIIGGVVVLFSFLNSALTAATQRFLNFNLGKGDIEKVKSVFCMSMNSYIILSVIFFIIAETIGLWFVNSQLNIPEERMNAANWVYQFSIITFIINLIRIPYNASIIAYERMDFYAYVSLVEVILKLVVVYALFIDGIDRLIVYSLLYTIVPFLINIAYKTYCNKRFTTTKFHLIWEKDTFYSLFSFSGWSLFGSLANVTASQGVNIIINFFWGVTVNAAVGIANQVSSHIMQFVLNFETAFQPQIVKTYAANEVDNFHNLIYRTSKFSFYLMYIISLPILLTTQSILGIWLINVPKYTGIFCQLILIFMIIEAIAAPLWMAVTATGNIKKYEIWTSLCVFLNLPLAYIVLKIGMPVYYVFILKIIIDIATFGVRLIYMRIYMSFGIKTYIKNVIAPIVKVAIIGSPIPYIISIICGTDFMSMLLIILASIIFAVSTIYMIGLTEGERKFVKSLITNKIIKKIRI